MESISNSLSFQHWIRLEIQRNILVEQLAIQVEPSDSSYMPSLVAVLAGSTVGGLKELRQCSIPSSNREFILLSGLTEVRRISEREGEDLATCPLGLWEWIDLGDPEHWQDSY